MADVTPGLEKPFPIFETKNIPTAIVTFEAAGSSSRDAEHFPQHRSQNPAVRDDYDLFSRMGSREIRQAGHYPYGAFTEAFAGGDHVIGFVAGESRIIGREFLLNLGPGES